jgi:hypothetical protein
MCTLTKHTEIGLLRKIHITPPLARLLHVINNENVNNVSCVPQRVFIRFIQSTTTTTAAVTPWRKKCMNGMSRGRACFGTFIIILILCVDVARKKIHNIFIIYLISNIE